MAPVGPYTNAHRQALAALERAVLEGTLRHPGDPAISQQLLAAAWRPLRQRRRLAVQGATIEAPGSVYDTRGMIAL